MTGVLTLGLCTGCRNNNEELTALQDQYTNSQKMIEQYKKDKEKLIEQNKELQKENKTLKQDKKIAELELEELKNKEEDTTDNNDYATKDYNNNYVTKDYSDDYNSNNNSTSNNESNNKSNNYSNNESNSDSSFDGASDDVTTDEPSQDYVYWTPNGKSYHSTKDCPTLSRSKVIYEGYNCPKTDPCNVCN
jgi:hypothetical protein